MSQEPKLSFIIRFYKAYNVIGQFYKAIAHAIHDSTTKLVDLPGDELKVGVRCHNCVFLINPSLIPVFLSLNRLLFPGKL
jgi:hypothetical protein